jgi:hypothetical protein
MQRPPCGAVVLSGLTRTKGPHWHASEDMERQTLRQTYRFRVAALAQQRPAQFDPRNASVQLLGSLSLREDFDRLPVQRLGAGARVSTLSATFMSERTRSAAGIAGGSRAASRSWRAEYAPAQREEGCRPRRGTGQPPCVSLVLPRYDVLSSPSSRQTCCAARDPRFGIVRVSSAWRRSPSCLPYRPARHETSPPFQAAGARCKPTPDPSVRPPASSLPDQSA